MTPIQKAKEIAEEKYPYPELNPEINNTLVRFRIYALREGYAAALLSGDGQEGKGLPEVVEPYVGDDKELVIKKVLQECGRILLTTYMMFQLKEFMEVMVVNDADKAEYVLSFRRFDSHLKRFPALPVADGEGEKATMKELVKKIFGDEAAEDKDIVDFYERVHKTAIETGNPPSLLAAATQKRDLLFDVLSSYERRIEIRAAALAFIKAYDELLDELLEIT